jgi:serine/threonine protein kinase
VFRDPEFGTVYRSQFLNEASLAGKLRHPHIVNIYDAVVEADSGYIAMEIVSGGDLAQFVKPDKLLPVEDVLQIGFKCCGALEYAFAQGIVHRDIKPANIMIVQGTDVKIADFGAAFLRKSQAVQTAAMGSPFYMSPEQIEGKELTLHSDMYSLGVVLYELLTGKRPFVADSLDALVKKILMENPAPPSSLRKGLPKDIDLAMLKLLGKKPDHRFATWNELAFELSRLGALVLPPGAIPDSEKFVSLKRVPMLSGLSDAEIWELARAGKWSRVPRATNIVREGEPGQSFFFAAKGEVKIVRQNRLINMVNTGEFFGEMAFIWGGELPRHATADAMTDLLLTEFEPAAVNQMSLGAQLQLVKSLTRNVVDRLALANQRLATAR